ncbi:4Fe-4S dicluster domain-containing protein [Adlercreutzia shanghongiae]|uniref:4Fe-4S dicluster domain-containing protein n=1 Tax=Adlercreutzia shanghongiae TaxID=3111773 RepID=A0ABU6J2I1_9ACTN|nr:4Fe-4S dicluster domain-containing protein [Adlercreutzia sp. R22]MEC4295929.1 4Fe-4S dicluster domain-containing protein [Adlercreutzia sp. R22]
MILEEEESMTEEKKEGVAAEATAAEAAADAAAPGAAAGVETAAEPKRTGAGSISRRGLFIGVGSTVALLGLGGLRYAGHNPINRPPGGTDEAHLVSGCIRCERCYEACPRQAIVPAKIEDGLLGMRSPMLDFNTGNYCDFCYEENGGVPLCVQVCPTSALELPADYTVGNPETGETGDIIIGTAEIDPRTCLAYRLTGCRDCYDACNYGAIELKDEGGANPIPYVVEDKCNGCGACQAVCLSLSSGSIKSSERAIVVRPIQG